MRRQIAAGQHTRCNFRWQQVQGRSIRVGDRHGEALTGFNRLARCNMMLVPGD
jgi:hypothetical protein